MHECMKRGGAKREGEADSQLSREPDADLTRGPLDLKEDTPPAEPPRRPSI